MQTCVSCPYNQLHKVTQTTLLSHIQNECQDKLEKALGYMFSHCPYNYLHILKKSLLQEHIKNCESKKKAEMIIDNKKLEEAVKKQFGNKIQNAEVQLQSKDYLRGEMPNWERECDNEMKSNEIVEKYQEADKKNNKLKNYREQQSSFKVLNRCLKQIIIFLKANWKQDKEQAKNGTNQVSEDSQMKKNQTYQTDEKQQEISESKDKKSKQKLVTQLQEQEKYDYKPPRFFNSNTKNNYPQQQLQHPDHYEKEQSQWVPKMSKAPFEDSKDQQINSPVRLPDSIASEENAYNQNTQVNQRFYCNKSQYQKTQSEKNPQPKNDRNVNSDKSYKSQYSYTQYSDGKQRRQNNKFDGYCLGEEMFDEEEDIHENQVEVVKSLKFNGISVIKQLQHEVGCKESLQQSRESSDVANSKKSSQNASSKQTGSEKSGNMVKELNGVVVHETQTDGVDARKMHVNKYLDQNKKQQEQSSKYAYFDGFFREDMHLMQPGSNRKQRQMMNRKGPQY